MVLVARQIYKEALFNEKSDWITNSQNVFRLF